MKESLFSWPCYGGTKTGSQLCVQPPGGAWMPQHADGCCSDTLDVAHGAPRCAPVSPFSPVGGP